MKRRKLKPKTSKTTTNPRDTAFNLGLNQAKEGYEMRIPRYKKWSQYQAHYRGYAEGCYQYNTYNKHYGLVL